MRTPRAPDLGNDAEGAAVKLVEVARQYKPDAALGSGREPATSIGHCTLTRSGLGFNRAVRSRSRRGACFYWNVMRSVRLSVTELGSKGLFWGLVKPGWFSSWKRLSWTT